MTDLIDRAALREGKLMVHHGQTWISLAKLDAAPTVECAACENYRTHHDLCHTCFGANLFQRRQPTSEKPLEPPLVSFNPRRQP